MADPGGQCLFVFLAQVTTADTLFNDIPGEEFIFSSFTVEIKGRIKSDTAAGGLQAAAFGKQRQDPGDPTVTPGQEALNLGVT